MIPDSPRVSRRKHREREGEEVEGERKKKKERKGEVRLEATDWG